MFQQTSATKKILKLNKRIRAVAGGTSASKTISILLWLIDYAQSTEGKLISVVSESFPHLKRGSIRDFMNIMESHKYFKRDQWNKTDFIYTFPKKSRIEFFSADQPGKVRGPRRDILFINEANNISYETYTQLEVRTKDIIWLDWNPVSEFWAYEEVINKDNCEFITLTYLDNEALDQNIVDAIEVRKGNKNWWKVYGLGQLGEAEGRIFTGWQMVDSVPHEARIERNGLDFGYSNDPTSIVAIYRYDGGFILDEILHRKGMANKQIADTILNSSNTLTIADSAEPKSIDEIRMYGVNIIGAQKGQGSVLQGIQYVQDQRISVTKRSLNIIKSYRNYLWETDKEGKIINEPEHLFSDAMDACLVRGTKIKTILGEKPIESVSVGDRVSTRDGFKNVLSVGITGKKKTVYEMETVNGRSIIGTGNHKVYTKNKGWVELCKLRYGDIILSCNQKQLFTKKRHIIDTQSQRDGIGECISITNLLFSIARFGKTLVEKFQKDIVFIIKTGIQAIMTSLTLPFLPAQSMQGITGGIKLKRYTSVISAVEITQASQIGKKIGSAQTSVRASGGGIPKLTMSPKNASFVGKVLARINMKKQELVEDHVLTVKELKRKRTVYNLSVETKKEYFANNILVHNCRYGLESLRPIDDDEPLPDDQSMFKGGYY